MLPTAVVALRGSQAEVAHAESLLRALGRLRTAGAAPPPSLPTNLGLRLLGAESEIILFPPCPTAEERDSPPAAKAGARRPMTDAVPWDRVLRRDEVNGQIQRLGRLPGIHSFVAGHSALGRPLWAMEVTVPRDRGWWSRAKLSGWKCSLLLNGRHHANEPASTSALLRMAELLATDDQWRGYLNRVNVIFLPGENADGMDLDDLLLAEHPNWMHHAARYNAAGLEFIAANTDPTTPHTEALAQPSLWRRWAPDIVCDCHGFPSHAWDQPFSGGQNPWFRDNSIPQALIYGILPTADTAPHRAAAKEIIERLTDQLGGDPEIALWNEHHAMQYKNYLQSRLPERFPAPFAQGLMLHQSFYDPEAGRPGLAGYPGKHPNVTTASLVTEVADETAQGAYLHLCARAHLLANRALLEYLFAANAPTHV
ncbi:MAG: M14 family zinc carboxypeptidase, partial [Chloroflexota bacterium]